MGGAPYGDRYRDLPGDGRGSVEVLGEDRPPDEAQRRWPVRAGAALAVVAIGALVVWTNLGGSEPDDPPAAASEQPERYGSPVTVVRNTPPPAAPVELTAATTEQWPTRGYSYVLQLDNPTGTTYEVVDVGPTVHGAEMLWDAPQVLAANGPSTLKVDFLVVNCAAVSGRAGPEELRLTLRPAGATPGASGSVTVMDLDLREASAALAAAGGVRCDDDRRLILSLG